MSDELTPAAGEISVRDYLDLLRRRKSIIIQTFVVVLIVGVVATLLSKPVYRATARLLVEQKSIMVQQIDSKDPILPILAPDQGHDIATQIELLQNDEVKLDALNRSHIPASQVSVDVRQVNQTDIVEIAVEAHRADYALAMAQNLPAAYIDYLDNTRTRELRAALANASDLLKKERAKLLTAEINLERVKSTHNVVNRSKQEEAAIEEASQLEIALQKARGDLAAAQAELHSLEATRARTPNRIAQDISTSNTARIAELNNEIAKLNTERASTLELFPASNVRVKQLDDQIASVKETLKNTPASVTTHTSAPNPAIADIQKNVTEARSKVASLSAQVNKMEQADAALSPKALTGGERQEAQYTADVELHRGQVAALTKDVSDMQVRMHAQHPGVSISQPATAAYPVSSRRTTNVIFAAVLGLVLGVCFALLQEYMDDRINSPDDTRRLLDAPILSYVPLVQSEGARLIMRGQGGGSLLESYRVMRSNVQFASVDSEHSSIVVTSTAPGEGKSVTASNLAVAMALDGKRVILVDADLRRPTLHTKFELEQRPGVTNVLVGHTDVEEALQETDVAGLRVLTAGPLPPNPAELLNSQAMRHLHQRLREAADVVIFDSPPFLATADAQVLSAMADGVIYVIQFGEARKSAVKHAVDLLHQAHARVLGIVFNKIDLSSRRDDYYYGYYRYYNYYHTPQLESGEPRRRRSTQEFEALLGENLGNGNAIVATKEDTRTEERS